jgi:hypothetical protein
VTSIPTRWVCKTEYLTEANQFHSWFWTKLRWPINMPWRWTPGPGVIVMSCCFDFWSIWQCLLPDRLPIKHGRYDRNAPVRLITVSRCLELLATYWRDWQQRRGIFISLLNHEIHALYPSSINTQSSFHICIACLVPLTTRFFSSPRSYYFVPLPWPSNPISSGSYTPFTGFLILEPSL